MVRLTTDLIDSSPQYINTLRDRELSLRACKIPVLENVGATMVRFQFMFVLHLEFVLSNGFIIF